jgi:hypothetical protein
MRSDWRNDLSFLVESAGGKAQNSLARERTAAETEG